MAIVTINGERYEIPDNEVRIAQSRYGATVGGQAIQSAPADTLEGAGPSFGGVAGGVGGTIVEGIRNLGPVGGAILGGGGAIGLAKGAGALYRRMTRPKPKPVAPPQATQGPSPDSRIAEHKAAKMAHDARAAAAKADAAEERLRAMRQPAKPAPVRTKSVTTKPAPSRTTPSKPAPVADRTKVLKEAGLSTTPPRGKSDPALFDDRMEMLRVAAKTRNPQQMQEFARKMGLEADEAEQMLAKLSKGGGKMKLAGAAGLLASLAGIAFASRANAQPRTPEDAAAEPTFGEGLLGSIGAIGMGGDPAMDAYFETERLKRQLAARDSTGRKR
jgi:hypothetical protein